MAQQQSKTTRTNGDLRFNFFLRFSFSVTSNGNISIAQLTAERNNAPCLFGTSESLEREAVPAITTYWRRHSSTGGVLRKFSFHKTVKTVTACLSWKSHHTCKQPSNSKNFGDRGKRMNSIVNELSFFVDWRVLHDLYSMLAWNSHCTLLLVVMVLQLHEYGVS